MFWAVLFAGFAASLLAAVLAEASAGMFSVQTVAGLMALGTILLVTMPRLEARAHHNHWVFVGIGIVALAAAGITALAR